MSIRRTRTSRTSSRTRFRTSTDGWAASGHLVDAALADCLEEARRLGFLSGAPVERQIDHSLGFAELVASLFPPPGPAAAESAPIEPVILDLGSGGGVPGLVLGERLPTAHLVLLDGSSRRVEWLRASLDRLGLRERAEVIGARAEDAAHRAGLRHGAAVVVARSFSRPASTAECAAGFLAPGGHLVVSEPPDDQDHAERWPTRGLAMLGFGPARAVRVRGYRFAVIRADAACDVRYPRRVGVPSRRPLF